MRIYSNFKIWYTAFLLLIFATGCGDPDRQALPGNPLSPPTVIFVTPPNGSTLVCPNIAVITATFSKAMNPATINTSTFTVSSGGANVAGTVTYVVATDIATFTANTPLAASTTFTATITTGAADTTGQTLASNFTWTFTTSAPCVPPAVGPPLGAACSFGILGATPVVSSVGPTHVTGDIGISPAASITGFPPGTFTGTEHLADAVAGQAQIDLTTAYNNAASTAANGAIMPADMTGLVLAPGNYRTGPQNSELLTGTLTLAGTGSPNDVWIFSIGSALTTLSNSQVIRTGMPAGQTNPGHNVFWQIGSSATLGTNSTFDGTIMAQASITLTTGTTLNGRALARTGAVALDSNPVNVPPCP